MSFLGRMILRIENKDLKNWKFILPKIVAELQIICIEQSQQNTAYSLVLYSQ